MDLNISTVTSTRRSCSGTSSGGWAVWAVLRAEASAASRTSPSHSSALHPRQRFVKAYSHQSKVNNEKIRQNKKRSFTLDWRESTLTWKLDPLKFAVVLKKRNWWNISRYIYPSGVAQCCPPEGGASSWRHLDGLTIVNKWVLHSSLFSRSCFLSRATYLLTIVSVCLIAWLFAWLLVCLWTVMPIIYTRCLMRFFKLD